MPVPWIKQAGQTLLDVLMPPRCLNCQTANTWFCDACVSQIDFISGPVCQKCGTPTQAYPSTCQQCVHNPLKFIDGIRVAAFFEDNPVRTAIHYLKYRNHRAVAHRLAELLADVYRQYNLDADVIVPIPLHKSRQKERGYNQSDLLARPLGNIINLPANTTAVTRVKKTRSQMRLGAEERHQNVAQAFACTNKGLSNRRVLLIDDVCTTGSTLDACAAALKTSGVQAVWGLTLAKAH